MMIFRAICIGLILLFVTNSAFAQDKPSFEAVTTKTAAIADAYFAAYVGLDWDRLEPLVADNASFQDRTADLVFGGVKAEGKAAMMKLFRENYASVSKMVFRSSRTFYSGHYGIFEGDLNWAVDMGAGRIVESVTPAIIVIRVEEGKVVEHRDLIDYVPFLKANRLSQQAKK